jgi:peptide/nickel transport system ATP-binding protein
VNLVECRDLQMSYRIKNNYFQVFNSVSLKISRGEIHGIVGESGSGKSSLGMAIMGLFEPNARIDQGDVFFEGKSMVSMSSQEKRRLWSKRISFVPQNPMDSLNPAHRIDFQMAEAPMLQLGISRAEADQHSLEMLRKVQIADPEEVMKKYPHQLSGGMLQRVLIAMALSLDPALVILDEPTTALDVTTQAVILDLVEDLIRETNAAGLFISHDLGVISQVCDQISVLYAGEILEYGSSKEVFSSPEHPYTKGLFASLPSGVNQGRLEGIEGIAPSLQNRPEACVFAPRCPVAQEKCRLEKPPLSPHGNGSRLIQCWFPETYELKQDHAGHADSREIGTQEILTVENLKKSFSIKRPFAKPLTLQAVDDVSFSLIKGTTLGVVGESGSGKTTLARAVMGLDAADAGIMKLEDLELSFSLKERKPEVLRRMRMVFQNSQDSLNPFMKVSQIIGRSFYRLLGVKDKQAIASESRALLKKVGLSADYMDRMPSQLSGGERQRVSIARSFAANPELVLADEPSSALDVSVQAAVLNLLKDLRAQEHVSYIIISHDLEVIQFLADRVLVMYLSEVVQVLDNLFEPPHHPYTEALISSFPHIRREGDKKNKFRLEGDIPSPLDKPQGCVFHTRCHRSLGKKCQTKRPPMRNGIRCHIPPDELKLMQQGGTDV